jgi:thioredoxin-related protein
MRIIIIFFILFSVKSYANDTTHLYDPYANVSKDLATAIAKAKKDKKHVMVVIGGNWCVWCYRFNSFVEMDKDLKNIQDNNYVVYHMNYSKENKNLNYMEKLGYPQRFGFPVMVILDADGNRIHTQDSGYLEKGNGYDKDKVKLFLQQWSPSALNPVYYKE